MLRIFLAIFIGIIGCSCRKQPHSNYRLEPLWSSAPRNIHYREILFFYKDYCIILSKDNGPHGYSFPQEKIHFRRTDNTIILETDHTAGILCKLESDGKLLKRIWAGNMGVITYFPITEEEADLLLQKYTIKNVVDSIHSLQPINIGKRKEQSEENSR